MNLNIILALTSDQLVWMLLSAFVLPIFALIVFSTVGLMINLWFPKLNWTNEVVVVKQSLSIMLSLFLNLIFVLGLYFIYFIWLNNVLNINIFLVICFVVFALIFALFIYLLKKQGKDIYNKL